MWINLPVNFLKKIWEEERETCWVFELVLNHFETVIYGQTKFPKGSTLKAMVCLYADSNLLIQDIVKYTEHYKPALMKKNKNY